MQSQILTVTFSHQFLRLFSQKSSFQTNPLQDFYQKNNFSFIITATNKKEICKIISSLNINKSCGPNIIPTKILHLVQDQISKHLATICNSSFSPGIFPTILKTVTVIPIHKKDSKLEVSNYRPISLLSNIKKIFETLMHSRLIEFFEERQILYYKQFGFQKDFSTNHAILNLLEIIQKALNDGQIACGIFIDLEKVFEIVSHDILLEKIDHCGIKGMSNDWFRSYLSDRSQLVSISGFNSDYKTIWCSTEFSSRTLAFLNFCK